MYSIKAVSQSTGLSTDTLRAWERRYGVVRPKRDQNARRSYDADDVTRLRLLRRATESGHPIRKLAALGNDELRGLLRQSQPTGAEVADRLVRRLLDAVSGFRSEEFERLLETAVVLTSPSQLLRDVISPTLVEVGDRWARGELSIAQERIVSESVRRLLTVLTNTYRRTVDGPDVISATLSGERHELGALFCAYLTASRGVRCYYLGPDTPADEIARMARQVDARVVAISLIAVDEIPNAMYQLGSLSKQLPDSAELWIGGAAARLARERLPNERCVLISDLQEFEDRLLTLVN